VSLTDYVKAIQCSRISLVFFSGLNNDSYTRRVFEIPAVGTFMLCQRTDDMETLFQPGLEAEYFSSSDELVKKARYYLDHEDERARIAAAGAARVREAGHDVFSRMRELADLLRGWHQSKGTRQSPSSMHCRTGRSYPA
jgi:spore maturation protein CgeB